MQTRIKERKNQRYTLACIWLTNLVVMQQFFDLGLVFCFVVVVVVSLTWLVRMNRSTIFRPKLNELQLCIIRFHSYRRSNASHSSIIYVRVCRTRYQLNEYSLNDNLKTFSIQSDRACWHNRTTDSTSLSMPSKSILSFCSWFFLNFIFVSFCWFFLLVLAWILSFCGGNSPGGRRCSRQQIEYLFIHNSLALFCLCYEFCWLVIIEHKR